MKLGTRIPVDIIQLNIKKPKPSHTTQMVVLMNSKSKSNFDACELIMILNNPP